MPPLSIFKHSHLQLLCDANLFYDDNNQMMFSFFKEKVVPVILKYQVKAVESQIELTGEDIESTLCAATKDQPTSCVSVNVYVSYCRALGDTKVGTYL